MPHSFPADLRIVNFVATLAGADDSLESINTNKLSDRAIVACKENNALYMLRRESVAAPSGDIIVVPATGPGRWFMYPTSDTGGAFDPIQNVRWLDAESTVTPENGSIRAPFTGAESFFDEVTAGGWKLMLPGDTTFGFTVPDLPSEVSVAVVFEGLSSSASILNTVSVLSQTGSPSLEFQHLLVGDMTVGDGSMALSFESCELHSCTALGTVAGTVRFVNCDVWAFGLDATDASFEGCTLGTPSGASTIAVATGAIRSCTFRPTTTLQIGTSATITDTIFGLNNIISVSAGQPITVDPFTYAQIIQNVTHSVSDPTYNLMPWVPYIKEIIHESFDVNPGATSQRDLGAFPLPPVAQGGANGGLCLVQFKSPSPNGARLVCVAATLDINGSVLVDVMNISLTAIESAVDPTFVVTYLPTLSPAL